MILGHDTWKRMNLRFYDTGSRFYSERRGHACTFHVWHSDMEMCSWWHLLLQKSKTGLLLTIQSGSSTVTLIKELSRLEGDPLGVSHLVWVHFAMGAQEEGVVDFFRSSGIIQPLFQPVQRDELIRLACGGKAKTHVKHGLTGAPVGILWILTDNNSLLSFRPSHINTHTHIWSLRNQFYLATFCSLFKCCMKLYTDNIYSITSKQFIIWVQ